MDAHPSLSAGPQQLQQPQEQWPAFNPFAAPPQKGQSPSLFQSAAAADADATLGRISPTGLSKLQNEGSGMQVR